MTARKRSEEAQKARRQKVQEKVHQVLYCDADWDEHEVYGLRFRKIIERSNIDETSICINKDVVKEYKKRIGRKLSGKEQPDKALVFYKILTTLNNGPMCKEKLMLQLDQNSEDCISINLIYMENSGLIERDNEAFRMTFSTKKAFIKIK